VLAPMKAEWKHIVYNFFLFLFLSLWFFFSLSRSARSTNTGTINWRPLYVTDYSPAPIGAKWQVRIAISFILL
jgi:hypothetical protein